MKFETHPPCDALKPFVKHFVISENADAQTYKVLPDTALVMGFQYSGNLAYLQNSTEAPLSTAGITGLMDGYRVFKNTPNTCSVLVVFKETGAAAFLNLPVNELFGESLSLDHFFTSSAIAETEEKLALATNDSQRIYIVEQLLLKHLQNPTTDLLVTRAIAEIQKSRGVIRMAELARQLNTSQSPLEKRFRKLVGASPKKFSSIVRIKNVRSMLNMYNYQQATYLSGYHDQAHFIKDFKTFTGETPERYVKSLGQTKLK
jgi:AraC-like DNA-binding protein